MVRPASQDRCVRLAAAGRRGRGDRAAARHPGHQQSNDALATLRTDVLPATLGKVPGISYAVTGLTAGNHDFDAQLARTVPWVFVFVLGLAFAVLMTSFRSVWIPALSIGLNVLSVGAAYGGIT